MIGLNSRIGSLQASILNEKTLEFRKKIKNQIKTYKSYQKFFEKIFITGFPKYKSGDSVSHFNILVKRPSFIKNLKKHNIDYKIYYPKPLYKQFNQKFDRKILMNNCENICKKDYILTFQRPFKKKA